jgi:hypothetical protein
MLQPTETGSPAEGTWADTEIERSASFLGIVLPVTCTQTKRILFIENIR